MKTFIDGQRILSTILFGSISLIAATGSFSGYAQNAPLPDEYWDAVEDSKTPEPQDVFRNLTPITRYNTRLIWDKDDRVLMATWTGRKALLVTDSQQQLSLGDDLWVTAVPDLQNFCQVYNPTSLIPLRDRLNQLLGLPLDTVERSANRRVVQLWVDPKYLFRPSPDPEITDHEAELGFRDSNEFVFVSLSYFRWFQDQYDQRFKYQGQPITRTRSVSANVIPYPWTQLGYTYDLGNPGDWAAIDPNRPKRVGLSEFVIREGSPISVQSVQSADEYCRKNSNSSN